MAAPQKKYARRRQIFNWLTSLLRPVVPILARWPLAWQIRSAFFRVGHPQDWLNQYGPHWDAPTDRPLPLALICDLRGASPEDQAQAKAALDALAPGPDQLLFLTSDQAASDLALDKKILSSQGAVLYLTAFCRPLPQMVAHYKKAMAQRPEATLWYADEVQTGAGPIKVFAKPAWDHLYHAHTGYVGQCCGLRGDLAAELMAEIAHRPWPHGVDLFDAAQKKMGAGLIGHIPVPLHSLEKRHFPSPRPRVQEPDFRRPAVSLVIPFKDRLDLLKPCLSSIQKHTDYPDWEAVLVDNGSTNGKMLAYLAQLPTPRFKVVRQEGPFNFSRLVNLGVKEAGGEIVVLLNNDITAQDDQWLTELVRYAVRPEVGCVGSKLLYPHGLIQHGGVLKGLGMTLDGLATPGHAQAGWPGASSGYFNLLASPRRVSAVTGAALAVRREVYWAVGGFDERLAVALNDVDFGLKLGQRNYLCVFNPASVLIHHESASRKMDRASQQKFERLRGEWALMREIWGEQLQTDDWYNPNLATEATYELHPPPGPREPRLVQNSGNNSK